MIVKAPIDRVLALPGSPVAKMMPRRGVVFWLDPEDGASQLGVAVTACLTVIAYHIALSAKLPEIPYLPRFDIFVFGATTMGFLTMIEVVITTGLAKTGRVEAALWLDRVSRVLFPVTLGLVSVYAFLWY